MCQRSARPPEFPGCRSQAAPQRFRSAGTIAATSREAVTAPGQVSGAAQSGWPIVVPVMCHAPQGVPGGGREWWQPAAARRGPPCGAVPGGWRRLEHARVVRPGAALGRVSSAWTAGPAAVAATGVSVTAWPGTPVTITVTLRPPGHAITRGPARRPGHRHDRRRGTPLHPGRRPRRALAAGGLAAHLTMSRPGALAGSGGWLAPGCSQQSRTPARRAPLRPGMPVRYARADLSLAPARR
jgi:hypothetical protein